MANIKVADSVIPSKANTPLDARCRVATEADILNIELPFVGLLVYVIETGKFYTVTAVKEKALTDSITVADAAVAEYKEFIAGDKAVRASDVQITDQGDYFQADTVENVLQEVGSNLKNKLDANKAGKAGGVASLGADGKVPVEQS